MPNAMFGAPTGESNAQADIRANKLAELTLAQGDVALEQAKANLSAQKQMLEMMSQPAQKPSVQGAIATPSGGVPASMDLASQMERLAGIAVVSGLPEKAREYATTASTLRTQASTIAKNEVETKIKHLDLIGSLMGNVHDEVSWRQANRMYEMTVGKPTPYAQLPYNPQVVDELRAGVASEKDRALTSAAKARELASEAVIAERNARVPLIRAQTELARERTSVLRKTGATALIPKAGDVKAITDLIIKDFGAGVLPEDARVLARPVAENMVRLMKSASLPQSEAANKAYQEAKAAGTFGGLRPRLQVSGSPEKPLELPADYSKLRPNMFYKGKGKFTDKVLLWTGDHFVPVGDKPGELKLSPNVDETPDDVVPDESEGDEEASANPDDELEATE